MKQNVTHLSCYQQNQENEALGHHTAQGTDLADAKIIQILEESIRTPLTDHDKTLHP